VNSKTAPLEITYCLIGTLKGNPRNCRTHSRRQVKQIANSIKTFGFTNPVLVDETGTIIAGHGRVEAAKSLGLESVPTIQIEGLTPDQLRAYVLADNKLAQNAGWDEATLAIELRHLLITQSEIEITDTGFEIPEIDLIIHPLASKKAKADPDDSCEAELNAAPVTKPGDLWLLGEHRILCADALEESSFLKLLGLKQASMVFVDPPYNLKIEGNVSGKGAVKHGDFAMASGEMDEIDFMNFLLENFKLLAKFSVAGSIHYIAMDWRHVEQVVEVGREVYSDFLNMCVWSKERAGQGSFYRSQHELFFVFRNGNGPPRNNIQLGKYGRNRTNIWNYPSAAAFSKSGDEGNLLALHPTVKPVALVADAILDCSSPREIVLDTFLGSGTTLIAAERTRRICYGMELDPLYVDVAIRRWQRHTGGRAVHSVSGKTFDEIANGKPESDHE
jgi:DNA modification methylase